MFYSLRQTTSVYQSNTLKSQLDPGGFWLPSYSIEYSCNVCITPCVYIKHVLHVSYCHYGREATGGVVRATWRSTGLCTSRQLYLSSSSCQALALFPAEVVLVTNRGWPALSSRIAFTRVMIPHFPLWQCVYKDVGMHDKVVVALHKVLTANDGFQIFDTMLEYPSLASPFLRLLAARQVSTTPWLPYLLLFFHNDRYQIAAIL